MSKPKVRAVQGAQTGVYKPEAIKVFSLSILFNFIYQLHSQDIADTFPITIPDPVASALASDVEYRIHQVIEVLLSLHFPIPTLTLYSRKQPASCVTADAQQ